MQILALLGVIFCIRILFK